MRRSWFAAAGAALLLICGVSPAPARAQGVTVQQLPAASSPLASGSYGAVFWCGQGNPGHTYNCTIDQISGYVTGKQNTWTGRQIFSTPSSAAASITLPPGTAPSSPNVGDLWCTSSSCYIQTATGQVNFNGGTAITGTGSATSGDVVTWGTYPQITDSGIATSNLARYNATTAAFTGGVTAANGLGVGCTPNSGGVGTCMFHGYYGSPINTGGSALQVFAFDSSNGSQSHYGINGFIDFMPTSQPTSLQYLDPDAILGNAWFDGTTSFCVSGGAPCSTNWNIAAVQGVFGQGFAWPNSTGAGLTLGWMSGVVGASQLGNGTGTGEGTVRNLAAVIADPTDNIYAGDATTKGTIKYIMGLDVMEDPCSNSKPVGLTTPLGCFGILFDTYFDDELHTRTGLNSAKDGDIASLSHPIQVKVYNNNPFQVYGYAGALGTGGTKVLDCGAVNCAGVTGNLHDVSLQLATDSFVAQNADTNFSAATFTGSGGPGVSLSSSYNHNRVVFSGLSYSAANATIYLQLYINGAWITSNYNWSANLAYSAGSTAGNGSTSDSGVAVTVRTNVTTSYAQTIDVDLICNAVNSQPTTIIYSSTEYDSSNGFQRMTGLGQATGQTVCPTQIRLLPTAGTISGRYAYTTEPGL